MPTTEGRGGAPGPRVALALILAGTLVPRLAALPAMDARHMGPDSAHFLNVARCFERGQGFSNPSAWPAWMKPARLPMPETFKEPGYSWLIAQAARGGADPFHAAQAMSLIAGLLLPFVVWLLARQLDADPLIALIAALIAAGSPLLVDKSVSVLVESPFALATALLFLAAGWRLLDADRTRRPLALDVAAGALFGAAYLLRAQTVLAAPAALVLMLPGRPLRRGAIAACVAAIAALAVMSPLLLRNWRLFGVPFYSDVPAFGIQPYSDLILMHQSLDRPPAAIPFALSHPVPVARHMLWSLRHFLPAALPRELYGNPSWLLGLAALPWALRGRWRWWAAPLLYVGLTCALMLAVHWDTYYFTSSMPAWCALAAAGLVWLAREFDARRAGAVPGARAVGVPALIALALLTPFAVAAVRPGRLAAQIPAEIDAARLEAPFLRSHLAADETAMVEVTSYFAWFADRPMAELVVADSARFADSVRRLHTRWAVLPDAMVPELAAHYPERRLPAALVFDRVSAAPGYSVYRVELPAAVPADRAPSLPLPATP
jgi:hypothetical protein